jgi:hypothetical protein
MALLPLLEKSHLQWPVVRRSKGADLERREGRREKNKIGSQDIRSFLMAAQTATPKAERPEGGHSWGVKTRQPRRCPTTLKGG